MEVGTKIQIINMVGEPNYNGKIGTITKINEGDERFGIETQWRGTWGGLAIQPNRDTYKILENKN